MTDAITIMAVFLLSAAFVSWRCKAAPLLDDDEEEARCERIAASILRQMELEAVKKWEEVA